MSRVVQWTNTNRYRRYPFVDDSSYTVYSVAGGNITNYLFTNDILLDFSFTTYLRAAPIVTLKRFEIKSNVPAPTSCTFSFEVLSSGSTSLVWIDVPVNSVFPLVIDSAVAEQYRLSCTIGEGIVDLCTWTPDVYYFNVPPVILPSRIVVMDKHRVTSIGGSTVASIRLKEDVYVEEGYNTSLTLTAPNTLTIAAQIGAGKGVSCDILPIARTVADGIISINQVLPDSLGNINIADGRGIKLTNTAPGVITVTTTIDDNRIMCNS